MRADVRYSPAAAARALSRKSTPRESARQSKIDHIVIIATDLFAREGLSGFSTRRIAHEAGVRLSTIQHYFGSKENLVQITINYLLARYAADYRAISRDKDRAALERFDNIVGDLLGVIRDKKVARFYYQLWSVAAQDESIGSIVRESYLVYRDALTETIGDLNPDLPAGSLNSLVMRLMSQIEGLTVVMHLTAAPSQPWEDILADTKKAWLAEIGVPGAKAESVEPEE